MKLGRGAGGGQGKLSGEELEGLLERSLVEALPAAVGYLERVIKGEETEMAVVGGELVERSLGAAARLKAARLLQTLVLDKLRGNARVVDREEVGRRLAEACVSAAPGGGQEGKGKLKRVK